MQRRRNSGNSPSFLQEEELSSLRIGFVYKTLSCYARRYIAFTVFSRIEEKVKSHWIVIDSVKRACVFLNSFFQALYCGALWLPVLALREHRCSRTMFWLSLLLVCSTAYPLGLLYDPNMIWKTEPAPQPTENLIQEQACALELSFVN